MLDRLQLLVAVLLRVTLTVEQKAQRAVAWILEWLHQYDFSD